VNLDAGYRSMRPVPAWFAYANIPSSIRFILFLS
jgi:hypothetical protein